MEYITEIVVALLALTGTLSGSFLAHRRSTALFIYRLEQLEQKVAAHNHLVETVDEILSSRRYGKTLINLLK